MGMLRRITRRPARWWPLAVRAGTRGFSSSGRGDIGGAEASLDAGEFSTISEQLLMCLQDAAECADGLQDVDVGYADGVLTLQGPRGTLVVNKHYLTQQIWYSSPFVGPQYFSPSTSAAAPGYVWTSTGLEGMSLCQALTNDLPQIVGKPDAEVSEIHACCDGCGVGH